MSFRVIEGGLSAPAMATSGQIVAGDVKEEGERRLREAGYERVAARERLTGIPVPSALNNFCMQIEFAVSAISRLDPIPADYRLDGYWPAFHGLWEK